MKRLKIFVTMMAFAFCFGMTSYAQKEEIKAFQEMNKKLLKDIRKQYKKDPKVEYSNGNFFIVIEGKVNKEKKLVVLNEDGILLTPDPVTKYEALNKDCVWLGQVFGKTTFWGVADYKNGNQILEPKYTSVNRVYKSDAGKNNVGVWQNATDGGWITYNEASNKTIFFSNDGKNKLSEVSGKYKVLEGTYVQVGSNMLGLYDLNGHQIFPQSYKDFEIIKDGFIISSIKSNNTTFYGGQTINPELPRYEIHPNLLALKWENGTPFYKVHKDDDWVSYAEVPNYKVEYVDDGQKYYDWGDNDKVIAYYEGEGMDAPHGGYYMGLAAKNIADVELAKLEWTIKTLKDSKTYYYPIKYPDSYSFNSMILGSQYIVAQDYLDKFIKNSEIDPEDYRIKKAKKYRGEAAASKTQVARKIEEYTEALTAASKKYAIDQQNAAIRQAESEALSRSIANGITNLLFGK